MIKLGLLSNGNVVFIYDGGGYDTITWGSYELDHGGCIFDIGNNQYQYCCYVYGPMARPSNDSGRFTLTVNGSRVFIDGYNNSHVECVEYQ